MKTSTILGILAVVAAVVFIVLCDSATTPKAAPGGTYCVSAPGDAARVEEAYGSILNLKDESGNPRPATTAEVEGAIFDWVESTTHDYEKRKDMAAFSPPPFQNEAKYHPTPTPKPNNK